MLSAYEICGTFKINEEVDKIAIDLLKRLLIDLMFRPLTSRVKNMRNAIN
jgi:hypothetical protein